MTMIDELKRKTAFVPEGEPTKPDVIDFTKFDTCDIPAAIVKHPASMAIFIICADGSLSFVESGRFEDDFDDLDLPDTNFLQDVCAMDHAVDALSNIFISSGNLPPRLKLELVVHNWSLFGLSRAAREALGLEEGLTMQEVSQHCRQRGGSPDLIQQAIEAHSKGLHDPLFIPEKTTSWSDSDEQEIAEVVTDILLSDPTFTGGGVDLTVDNEDGENTLQINYEDVPSISSRAFKLLNALCDFDRQFSGKDWEYNDGAIARESGYTEYGAILFAHDFTPPSTHERLSALGRVIKRLELKGIKPEGLVEPAQNTQDA